VIQENNQNRLRHVHVAEITHQSLCTLLQQARHMASFLVDKSTLASKSRVVQGPAQERCSKRRVPLSYPPPPPPLLYVHDNPAHS
jgi:hypothetical protein